MPETTPLLPPTPRTTPGHAYKPGHVSLWRVILMLTLLIIPLLLLADLELPEIPWPGGKPIERSYCSLYKQMEPRNEVRNKVLKEVGRERWLLSAVEALQGAVRIPTETLDSLGRVGEDPAWDKFVPFHDYLESTFPLVHQHLDLTKVNNYGLLYEWRGSDRGLKPLLLMAHQDTVPVDPTTMGEWTHPPWSGYYDGEWIWGRGVVDDKLGLISILTTLETLLSHSFSPSRTLILSFGFDEEISGLQGASQLASHLEQRYGKDGIAMLLDEGVGMKEWFGSVWARPAVGEKGYMDIKIEVEGKGGHSSVPPRDGHTTIGILAQMIAILENNLLLPRISRTQPLYRSLHCLAEHSPSIPERLKRAIKQSIDSDRALRKTEEIIFQDDEIRSAVGTTQAVDLVQGGVKANALPEKAWTIVNTRIATDSSVDATKEHYIALLQDFAIASNYTLSSFGRTTHSGGAKKITMSDAYGASLEPAPITPLDGAAWKIMQGSILSASATTGKEAEVKVMPFVMTGNTDTRYYWNLTRNIFRYRHIHQDDTFGIHTVDERVRARALRDAAHFFTDLILNVDEASFT